MSYYHRRLLHHTGTQKAPPFLRPGGSSIIHFQETAPQKARGPALHFEVFTEPWHLPHDLQESAGRGIHKHRKTANADALSPDHTPGGIRKSIGFLEHE
jgi:hypothetical protein